MTFGFFDLLSMSFDFELGLGPSQIKIFLSQLISFWGFFRFLISLEVIQWYILIVQIIKKQNGGQNQDGRQAWIFHSSVNFYEYQLKLGGWKERPMKKIIVEVIFFFKLQNDGFNQDGVSSHGFCFWLSNSHFEM
jgi:hypothetical protein